MNKKDKSQVRLLFLGTLIITLLLVYISTTWLFPTLSRYIKREQDEIRAHYTALHISSTGEGKTIALENGVGYIEFDLRNYVDENVTQRDIVYTISRPTIFYDSKGTPLASDKIDEHIAGGNKIHVLDVWNKAKLVEDQTYLYDIEIVQNSGEVISEGVYGFTYEKLETGAKGKTHRITCKVTARDLTRAISSDRISIVVKLSQPYEEVVIINMNVSDRLITFSHKEIEMFYVPFDKLYVQTADIFAYIKNEDGIMNNDSDRLITTESGCYKYTSYAIKLTLYWTGYLIDETKLEEIYTGTSSKPGDIKDYDTVNQYGQNNDIGTIPNPNIHSPYLDTKQARIARLNSVYDSSNGHHGEMVLFMPQGSDIFMHFSKTATMGTIYAKIEIYVEYWENNTLIKSGYELYSNEVFGGYNHSRVDGEDYYKIASYGK